MFYFKTRCHKCENNTDDNDGKVNDSERVPVLNYNYVKVR